MAATGLATIYNPAMRAISGSLISFVLPGYLLTLLLWQERGQISGVRRLGLIAPASMLAVGGALLLLSYSVGYQPERAIGVVVLLNAALAAGAYLRCKAASKNGGIRRDWLSDSDLLGHFQAFNRWHGLSLMAAAVLAGSIAYTILTPRHTPKYTEFYLLTEDGRLPIPGQDREAPGALQCVIRNHEGQPMDYRLLVVAITPGGGSALRSEFLSVADGSAVRAAVDLSDAPMGAREFLWLLFVPGQPKPYLSLNLAQYQRQMPASTRSSHATIRQPLRDAAIR